MSPLRALILASLLAGCSSSAKDTEPGGACASAEDCPNDLQCIAEQCIDVQCTTSAECPFESYCDQQNYACVDGCREDGDCLSGDVCDAVSNTCVGSSCRDTELDCAYGQYCNTDTGECYDDTREHCKSCDVTATNNQCGSGECFFYQGDTCNNSGDCDDGYTCSNVPGYGKICHADFCLMSCNPNQADACPRGFDCIDFGTGGYCNADCIYMTENGYL
mgnify:CR=1 FL=1